MVKTPRTRHSKSHRAPVTIELGADDVKPVEDAKPEEAAIETAQIESIEVPEQPDTEMLKMEGEPETVAEKEPDTAASFGRAPEQPAQPPVKSGSAMNPIAAGLIGAVLAIGGLYGLQTAGVVGAPGQGATVSLEPLETQISALRGELDAVKATPAPDAGLADDIAQIKGEIAALQSSAQAGGEGDAAALAALGERIGKLESQAGIPEALGEKVAGLETAQAAINDTATKIEGRIALLEQSVTRISGRVEQQASQPKAALAIVVTALKSAVDRGSTFTSELDAVAAVAPNAPEIATLRSFAETGVATRDELLADFSGAIDAMLTAGTPEDPNAGIMQRLLDSAKSVVKVRPVGPVAGDDPAARTARMEVALKSGDDAGALAEFDALPDAVRQAGAAFGEKLKSRAEVLGTVDRLVASALKPA